MSQGLDWIFSFELKSGKTKKKSQREETILHEPPLSFMAFYFYKGDSQDSQSFVCEFHGKRLLLQICGIKLPLAPASLRLKDMNVFLSHIFI